MPTLLQAMHRARAARREAMRVSVRESLREALREIYPAGTRVYLFGSITRTGKFDEFSDIDLAIEGAPENRSEFWLQGELEARLGCGVDVVLLDQTRLRAKIEREGELWSL